LYVKPIRVTSPIATPRYLSFDPTSSPCTDSLKYVSIVSLGWNQRPEPITTSTIAPDDGADHEEAELEVVGSEAHGYPTRPGFAPKNARTRGPSSVAKRGVAFGDDALRATVEQDHAIRRDENAAEIVRR
jgi:hypothetical protein